MNLYDLIGNLKDVGFYDILLPWALFFAMTYGLLTSVGPFKTKDDEGNENTPPGIPAIISMAVAFFIIAYTPFGLSFGSYLAILFGQSGTVLVGLLVMVLFLGMAGINMNDTDDETNILVKYKKEIAIGLVAIVAIIYFGVGNLFAWINIPGITEDTIVTLLMLAIIIGGVFWITKKK